MFQTASLKKNFFMNILLTASSFLFPLITFPYVSRVLLPEGTGRVAFVLSIISYFSMFASLGIPTYGIRICAQVRDDKEKLSQTVQELFIINAAMTAVTYLIYVISVCFVEPFREEKALFLICGVSIFFNMIGMEWLYKALEQYQYITIRSVLVKLVSVVLMFILVRSLSDYLFYGALTIFAGVGSNLLNFINVHKYISLMPRKRYNLAQHLKPILLLFALNVATTIYTSLDVAMLRFMTDNQQVGYYNAAVKVKDLLVAFVTALGAVLLPRISYYISVGKQEEFWKLLKRAFDFVMFLAIPLCVYFILMADKCVLFLSGPAYYGSIVPMRIITATIFCIGLTNLIGMQMLVPTGKEILVTLSTCIGALTDVILNCLLIPKYGASGAAAGTLAAEIAVLIVQLWIIRAYIPRLMSVPQIFKILLAVSLSATAVLFVRSILHAGNFITLCVTVAVFGVSYLAVLFLLHYKPTFLSK